MQGSTVQQNDIDAVLLPASSPERSAMPLPSDTPATPDASAPPRRMLLRLAAAAGALGTAILAGCGFGGRPAARSAADMAFRRQSARHLYGRYANRIYRGMLPPMLYAVGTLEVNLAANGQVRSVRWMRGPTHVPEVMREIETMVRAASPFPPPGSGGGRYVDTWLWDRSGRFQLDSLTEGQLRA